MFATKLAVVALLLTVCFFAYVCGEDKTLKKAKKIFEDYDSNKTDDNAKEWWYRDTGLCTSDEFKDADGKPKDSSGESDEKAKEIKCEGTPNKMTCVIEAMGHFRVRTYKCCEAFANLHGDGCEAKPKAG